MSNQKSIREILETIDFGTSIKRIGTFILVILLFVILLKVFLDQKYVGEEVARLAINDISTMEEPAIAKDTSLFLEAGEVLELWSEMSIKYRDTFYLNYYIEILKDSLPHEVLDFNAMKYKLLLNGSWNRPVFSGQTSKSFMARYTQLIIPEDATYTFKGNLVNLGKFGVTIIQAEIVLRHPPKKE